MPTISGTTKLVWLNALCYVTLLIILVIMGVYTELMGSYYQLFLLPSLYVPVLSIIAAYSSPAARHVALGFTIVAMTAAVACIIYIAISWSLKGDAYLGLKLVKNGIVALWVVLGGNALLAINSFVNVYLLVELSRLKRMKGE